MTMLTSKQLSDLSETIHDITYATRYPTGWSMQSFTLTNAEGQEVVVESDDGELSLVVADE